AEATPEADSATKAEATSEAESTTAKAEVTPEAESTAKAEATPEAESTAKAEATPEAESTTVKAEATPEAESTAKADVNPEAESTTKDGKTAIALAPQQVKNPDGLKTSEERRPEEVLFSKIVQQVENTIDTVEIAPSDIKDFPEPIKFSDRTKFQVSSQTSLLKSMSPDELFTEFETRLHESGFAQISKEAPYGEANTFKVNLGSSSIYLYLVSTKDNRTAIVWSNKPPF
ncbi:MAG TPA: hypothetical protein DCE56_28800, partial [Cyanobacteria bacterium UBA8553]|nr:hypothetical protein [Cyanobacteria bacterium UBA8553]